MLNINVKGGESTVKNLFHQIGDNIEESLFLKTCMIILLIAMILFIGYIIGLWFGSKLFI